MSEQPSSLVRFEGFTLNRARWQLQHGGELLALNRKTFDLLLYLLDHADRVVTKDELLQALWPNSFIEESNLTQQVFLLRRALGKHEPGKRIIETTPGRGYRIVVPVQFVTGKPPSHDPHQTGAVDGLDLSLTEAATTGSQATQAASATEKVSSRNRLVRSRYPLILVCSTAVAALFLIAFRTAHFRRIARVSISNYRQVTHDGHAKAIGGTDGNRIYFTRLDKSRLAQIQIAGKSEELLQLAITDPWSGDVSPDGSTLLIISQAGGLGPASSLWTLELVGGSLRQLGNAVSSGWSPDGRSIVYASAGGDIFVMQRDGSNVHRIASVGGNVRSIAWSPDGRLLRYSRDGLLFQMAPNGSNMTQVLPGWSNLPTQWSGHWAQDGTFFFVADGQIWCLDERDGFFRSAPPAPVQLTFGPTVWDHPLPGPDGQRLLASGRTTHGELVRLNAYSGRLEPFLEGISAEFVTFSPDGKSVAYVSYPEGILWRAAADGTHPLALTDSPVYPKSLCWSPDGTRLAFVDRTEEGVNAIFLVFADGSGKPQRLFQDDKEAETDPSWSPDGKQIAFSTSPNVGASAKSKLRLFRLSTGKITEVAGSDGLLVPRWSPDGRTLSAMTLDSKGLKLLDVFTGRWSSLETGAVAFPEWSHDGRWIYYVRWTADPALLRIGAFTGRREVLADLTGQQYTGVYTLWMGLDSQNNPMMLKDTGSDDIYALTLQRQ